MLSSDGVASLLDHEGRPLHPAHATAQTQYARAKGPKVLNSVTIEPTRLAVTTDEALLTFDHVFAIGTNTRVIRGRLSR